MFRYKTLTIIWVLVIMGLTFTPGPNLPPLPHWDILAFDTFVHGFIFAVLVFLMANAFRESKSKSILVKYPVIISVIISITYGCFIEVIQLYIPGRSFDVYDIYSNSVGCALGVIALIIQYFIRPSISEG